MRRSASYFLAATRIGSESGLPEHPMTPQTEEVRAKLSTSMLAPASAPTADIKLRKAVWDNLDKRSPWDDVAATQDGKPSLNLESELLSMALYPSHFAMSEATATAEIERRSGPEFQTGRRATPSSSKGLSLSGSGELLDEVGTMSSEWELSRRESLKERGCVIVVFTATNLRVNDNYPLAMGLEKAKELGVPIITLFVFDGRTYAQPSSTAGFFRKSPERARFAIECVNALRHALEFEQQIPLLVRTGYPEFIVPDLCRALNAKAVFTSAQYAPHEKLIEESIRLQLTDPKKASAKRDGKQRSSSLSSSSAQVPPPIPFHTVWDSTLVHYDDMFLSTTLSEVPESQIWFLDEWHQQPTRPTLPYNCGDGRLLAHHHVLCSMLMTGATTSGNVGSVEGGLSEEELSDIKDAGQPTSRHSGKRKKAKAAQDRAGAGEAYSEVFANELAEADAKASGKARPQSSSDGVVEEAADEPAEFIFPQVSAHLISPDTLAQLRNAKLTKGLPVSALETVQKMPLSPLPLIFLPSSQERSSYFNKQDEPYLSNNSHKVVPNAVRGAIPSLAELGYGKGCESIPSIQYFRQSDFTFEGGELAALKRIQEWFDAGGPKHHLKFGHHKAHATEMSKKKNQLRISPWLATGCISPRTLLEHHRRFAHQHEGTGMAAHWYQESKHRLAKRDYWHFMGLKFGRSLFFPYGPRPENTNDIPDWKMDDKIVKRWCHGLTGIPFADGAMRELVSTGYVPHEGRQALSWLLTRGYGQDWRVGAEWFERCSLDYDPFLNYGMFAFHSQLIPDDFAPPVRDVNYIAHKVDQTGLYVRSWVPEVAKLPSVYVHRPHVLTERMQKMHNVHLGATYPYPVKLWDGAHQQLSGDKLTAYFPSTDQKEARLEAGKASPQFMIPHEKYLGWMEAHEHGTHLAPAEHSPIAYLAPK